MEDRLYKASDYDLQAQRHVWPLYVVDQLGSYSFSSTMTFVKFRSESFCIFAAHALPRNDEQLSQIGVLGTDGKFMSLAEVSICHTISRESDLVACHTEGPFERKNYFDLDSSTTTPETELKEEFSWIGFPAKKALTHIHKTKSTIDQVQQVFQPTNNINMKATNANFLIVSAKQQRSSESEIIGEFYNNNVTYEHEGFKQQGYSLKGMSGGALFRELKTIPSSRTSVSDMFKFIGIGLEYRKSKLIIGASRMSVTTLLEEVLEKSA